MLSQATTPSHSVRPCQLLWFCLLLRFCLLLSPSALESIRCNSFRQPLAQLHLQPTSCHCSCTALHFISSFTVSLLFLWRADSALMSHTLLLCQISWLSLELHVLSEGLMSISLYVSMPFGSGCHRWSQFWLQFWLQSCCCWFSSGSLSVRWRRRRSLL